MDESKMQTKILTPSKPAEIEVDPKGELTGVTLCSPSTFSSENVVSDSVEVLSPSTTSTIGKCTPVELQEDNSSIVLKQWNELTFEYNSDEDEKIYEHSVFTDVKKKDEAPVKSVMSIAWDIAKKLKPGSDLISTSMPYFILRPASIMENVADFTSPTNEILQVSMMEDPVDRMIAVLKNYLAPLMNIPTNTISRIKYYNPVLGEQFHCHFEHDDSKSVFISEQVSHHPPITAHFFENKKKNIRFEGSIEYKSEFHGTKILTSFDTNPVFTILNLNEEYHISYPCAYVRGVFFGSPRIELDNRMTITCRKTNLCSRIDFKSNSIKHGCIYREPVGLDGITEKKLKKSNSGWLSYFSSDDGKVAEDIKEFEIIGNMTNKVALVGRNKRKGKKIQLIDYEKHVFPLKVVKPVREQDVLESRRLWHLVTKSMILHDDEDRTMQHKLLVEEHQRKLRKERNQKEKKWEPQLFRKQLKDGKKFYVYAGKH